MQQSSSAPTTTIDASVPMQRKYLIPYKSKLNHGPIIFYLITQDLSTGESLVSTDFLIMTQNHSIEL